MLLKVTELYINVHSMVFFNFWTGHFLTDNDALTFLFAQCFLMHLFVIGSRTTHHISVMAQKYAVDDIIMHSAGYRTYERVGLV